MKSARVPCIALAVVGAMVVPALAQRVQLPSTLPSSSLAPSPAEAGPAPTATLEGTIQPPPADWDPYATPETGPPALLPEDPYLQAGPPAAVGGTFTTMRRLLDEVRLDYLWMPGTAADEFGIHDLELSATFAIPFLYNTETPLLVTPGFAFHWWNGPARHYWTGQWVGPFPVVASIDMPARAYDAYLDAAWNPQVTPWLGGELSFRVGVYSDFKKVTEDSIRFPSKGLAVLTFSPSFKIKAGVVYLDRYRVKILPAGGIIWTPNADVRFEILFPDPKISTRLTTWGNTEWWAYARGEYGGGAWTVNRVNAAISPDLVGYNDLRFCLGLEFIRLGGLRGLFEVGVAFDRELRYRSHQPAVFYPNSTMFLRTGLAY